MTKWRRSMGTHMMDVRIFMSGANVETTGPVMRRLPRWRRWSRWNVPASASLAMSR
jgi:hypothetical protein